MTAIDFVWMRLPADSNVVTACWNLQHLISDQAASRAVNLALRAQQEFKDDLDLRRSEDSAVRPCRVT